MAGQYACEAAATPEAVLDDPAVDVVERGRPCEDGFADGRQALVLAEVAYRSLETGRLVKVAEIA